MSLCKMLNNDTNKSLAVGNKGQLIKSYERVLTCVVIQSIVYRAHQVDSCKLSTLDGFRLCVMLQNLYASRTHSLPNESLYISVHRSSQASHIRRY